MQIILIPTDFSVVSQNAIEWALTFFKNQEGGYRVLLLNTYLVPSLPAHQLITMHDELRKKSIEGLEHQLQLVTEANRQKKASFEILSHMGALENVMAHIVQTQHVDCIVMGMSHTQNKKEILEKNCVCVLNRLQCPILIVPA